MKNTSHYKDSKHRFTTKMDKENADPYTKIEKSNQMINGLKCKLITYFFPEDVCYHSCMLRFVANKKTEGN